MSIFKDSLDLKVRWPNTPSHLHLQCYRNWDKLWPDGSLRPNAGFTLPISYSHSLFHYASRGAKGVGANNFLQWNPDIKILDVTIFPV